MGRDASVYAWYGVAGDPPDEILERHERSIEEDGEGWEVERAGIRVTLIDVADGAEPVGVGAEFFYHDWDYPPKRGDEVVEALTAGPSLECKAIVDAVLDEIGAEGDRGVWIHTRYF